MNIEVLSTKLLKLLVVFSILLIETFVPFTKSFKNDKLILFLLFGINFVFYLINDPAFKRPVSFRSCVESKTLGPNVAKENIRSGSFSIIPLILNFDLPK